MATNRDQWPPHIQERYPKPGKPWFLVFVAAIFVLVIGAFVTTGITRVINPPLNEKLLAWEIKDKNNVEVIFGTGEMATGQGRYLYTNSGKPYLDTYGGNSANSSTVITDDTWHHLVAIYTPSGGFMYIDGTLDATPTYGSSGYVSQSGSAPLGTRIGCERTGALPTPAYISLLRLSNSAPSPEQVKKMYEDEKFLFQENAKATLYGSSNLPTALVYDEVTDQIHVGTSSGRSDFQGLRRINNTTQQVETAISAHDTFIIEQ